ncbi:outer membrane protein assembly factor BamB family protein [Archangium lipolyticum]|uniref:outer membrane protein assembly factor BamB family protein n=1 Tax=Archangium lipolyticum TaxID=2970465 RepID=UPI00214A4D8D|nr:PQQ-binding-like beta-propeller repeat protein [Archangium lipolyticum]
MKRLSWALCPLLLLVGCTLPNEQEFLEERTRTCGQSFQCPEGLSCVEGFCVGTEVDATQCSPACAPYEACTAGKTCVPRYEALGMLVGDNDKSVVPAGPVLVYAAFLVRQGFAANLPETLSFSAVREDGGPGGSFSVASRGDGELYRTEWTPPGEGVYRVTVAHPVAGGPSTTRRATVDATPPSFAVRVPPADAGVASASTTYTDPSLPNAWRRDQVVPVEVRTNEPNLDVPSVSVRLHGTDGGAAPAVAVTPFAPGEPCDAGFCGVARVKLWEPPFAAFRGQMTAEVRGRDKAGHEATGSSSFPVTRWKWAFNGASGTIKSTPAIGAGGTVYVGTNASSDGKVLALTPAGTVKWESRVGAVVGGPAVGASDGGSERVYVSANTAADGSLFALDSKQGEALMSCHSPVAGAYQGGLALGRISSTQHSETAVSVYRSSEGFSFIAGIGMGNPYCPVVIDGSGASHSPGLIPGTPVVMNGDNLFYSGFVSNGHVLTSYAFGSPYPRANWPVGAPILPTDVVLVGSELVGAAADPSNPSGGLFKHPQAGAAALTPLYPSTPWSSLVFRLAVGSSNMAFFGAERASGGGQSFNRFDLSTRSTTQTVARDSAIRSTPVLGANGAVYTVTTAGRVEAWAADSLSSLWSSPASSALGSAEASPTLDCPRDASGALVEGNHGVLYVPVGGSLYAFVVDSRGLDANAPWPKYQHDVRNTGNPATPIGGCP